MTPAQPKARPRATASQRSSRSGTHRRAAASAGPPLRDAATTGGRRVRYQVAASLDGYITDPNGGADWIPMDPDIDFGALFAQFDTLLMGRRTFEGLVSQGNAGSGKAFGMTTIVVSSSLDGSAHHGVQVIGGDLAEAVAAIKAAAGKDIWLFGGGQLFRSLLDLDLVDRVEVAVVPVLLGGGVPLLSPREGARPARLRLSGHRVYAKSGIVLLEYDVAA